MKKPDIVRLGIIGTGNMGTAHGKSIQQGNIPGMELTAVCDPNPEKLARFEDVPGFATSTELLDSGLVNAVLIATPHYSHTTIGIEVLKRGLHLLVEKPISVHKADCERLVAAYRKNRKGKNKPVFAAMFNQRTDPLFQTLRKLIQSGELGEIRRMVWTVTNWFRTCQYYDSGDWRATWGGEGGGVLLNQCPHQLDLFHWFFGMPKTLRANCHFGKYHDIEVEDEVTAYMEFPNGATGVFITSTGEAPGSNRLEIAAENGQVILENGQISFNRNEIPMTEFSRTTTQSFATPGIWKIEIPYPKGDGRQHDAILKNFTGAILRGEPLIAPAEEGIHSVELANAMLLSTFQNKTVDLPINSSLYERHLKQKIKNSKPRKKKKSATKGATKDDFATSFR